MPLIETSFEVPAGTDEVWGYLLDIEKVVPCMPGAELTETIDDDHWKGKMKLKLGPVSLVFAGKVEMQERNEEEHRVVLEASAMEQRGKGAASAKVTSSMERFDGGTRVHVAQDIKVSGQAAQFSRGMMEDVATKVVHQFADCLKAQMEAEGVAKADGGGGGEVERATSGALAAEKLAAAPALGPSPAPARASASSPAHPAGQTSARPGAAELDASGLVLGALRNAVLRTLSRVFRGASGVFRWLADTVDRAARG
ncbi:MAG: SRPBCC family protein [Actinomycetota bacterium]|nr:SRPBCC family protein [Actinomycetota bacterium]